MMRRWILGWCIGMTFSAASHTEYTVQPVDDVPIAGTVWNLTQAEPIGPEIDYRIDTSQDKSRIWSPVKRFDFMTTQGDSVLQTCAETRSYRTIFSPGILRILPDNDGGSLPFSFKGRIHQSRFVVGEGHSTVFPAVNGSLVSLSGDSIPQSTLHHDVITMRWSVTPDSLANFGQLPDSMIYTTIVDSYRIMSPDIPFPEAFKRIDTTLFNERTVSHDSTAWVLSFTPSAAVERTRRNLLPNQDPHNRMEQQADGIDKIINSPVNIIVRDNDIVVNCNEMMTAEVVITDMLGRTYYRNSGTLKDYIIPTRSLPQGEYLIQVIPQDGLTITSKFARQP